MVAGFAALDGLAVANGEPLEWGRRTYVMGVINLTPDSFSGDGLVGGPDGRDAVGAAVELARRFAGEGADFLDVGAESTRPGHIPATKSEELRRLLPALEAITARVNLPISVDTYKPGVARAALAAGAGIINDVWGLRHPAESGDELAAAVAESGAGLVLMHNQTGHHYINGDVLSGVIDGLRRSVDIALAAWVPRDNLIVDPGIGFGKTADQNIEVLRQLRRLARGGDAGLGLPLLVGTSRKSTIGRLLDLPPEQRLEGTAATVALAIAAGADIVRVHDVAAMARVCKVSDAIVRDWRPAGWETTP